MGRRGPRLGEDPTLRERDWGDDGSRGGEWGGAAGRTNGEGRDLCSFRTTAEDRKGRQNNLYNSKMKSVSWQFHANVKLEMKTFLQKVFNVLIVQMSILGGLNVESQSF